MHVTSIPHCNRFHGTRLNGLLHLRLARSIPQVVERLSRPGDIQMLTILLVILLLTALGALPTWPHNRSWGYFATFGVRELAGTQIYWLACEHWTRRGHYRDVILELRLRRGRIAASRALNCVRKTYCQLSSRAAANFQSTGGKSASHATLGASRTRNRCANDSVFS